MLAVAAAAVVVVAGATTWWLHSQVDPGGRPGARVAVTIPKGASTTRIGAILASAGVIRSGSLFPFYVKVMGDGPLYPGTYHLRRGSSYGSVASALESGPPVVVERLTVPEGYTVAQIAAAVAALPKLHLSAARFLAAASSGEVRSAYEPAGVDDLEGLLFPATYQVRQGETEAQVLRAMVSAFDQRAAEAGLTRGAYALGLTPYQVVTVASIVEREAKVPSDRGPVASVLYNRLRAGMPLGADSTQTYWLRRQDPGVDPTPAQLDQPSPYNTRLNKGLPPTPISDPGMASLEAALHPPSTPYLYFVEVQPDGKLGFASTSAGFRRLEAECRAARLC